MEIIRTPLEGLLIIKPDVFEDERGYFFESFSHEKFFKVGLDLTFVQDNESRSKKNVLRGLHFQAPPFAQGKLVRVMRGSVLDVAVDIRNGSPTYGKWAGIELSAQNHKQMWIPPGLAHGFLVLTPTAEFLYKTTDYYDPKSEVCLLWNDPTVGIEWPLPEGVLPNMNAKDAAGLVWDQTPKF